MLGKYEHLPCLSTRQVCNLKFVTVIPTAEWKSFLWRWSEIWKYVNWCFTDLDMKDGACLQTCVCETTITKDTFHRLILRPNKICIMKKLGFTWITRWLFNQKLCWLGTRWQMIVFKSFCLLSIFNTFGKKGITRRWI